MLLNLMMAAQQRSASNTHHGVSEQLKFTIAKVRTQQQVVRF